MPAWWRSSCGSPCRDGSVFTKNKNAGLTSSVFSATIHLAFAGVAHLVERDLAKVEVASSSLVARSKKKHHPSGWCFLFGMSRADANSLPRPARSALNQEVRQGSCVGCRQRVEPRDEDIAARTLEYMTAMETAPQPEASGLEGDYRILADFNGTILAGTHSKHGIQFVTWDWDYDRTDVALRWRNTGAAEKWDRKKQSFRRNPFLASFDYFIFRQRCVIL